MPNTIPKHLKAIIEHPVFNGCGQYNNAVYGGKPWADAVVAKHNQLLTLPKTELSSDERAWIEMVNHVNVWAS